MALRRRRDAESEEADVNMTPMLDIVFIMLIFFIVTSSFTKESGIDVQRPQAVTAEVKEHASILVAITDQGEIWIDRRQIDERALRANLERLHAQNPKGTVVIQADERSQTRLLVKVMDAARQAGIYDVAIAAAEGN